ncbi:MAG: MATE family efflux transporter [Lachnospiraceae bacterium]|nr:MATE family efflux transporter [Lachnospiraceae bacterium]
MKHIHIRHKYIDKSLIEGAIWKKLLIFFLPIAAGTCIQQLYNAVDGLIVAKYVGTAALAAVGGSSSQIINLLIGFFVALTSGASVVIAQTYGAGKDDDVRRASGNAITVCLLIGAVLTVIGLLFSRQMLELLRTPSDTVDGAEIYLKIYFSGVVFVLVLNMESNMLRAVGDSTSPFIFMLTGCLSNILMDFVFVKYLHWGVAGVAVATVLAQVLNTVLLTVRLFTAKASYRLSLSDLKLKGRYIKRMMQLGIPAGLQSTMYSVSNMIIQVGVNSLGTVVVASWAMSGKTDGIYWAVSSALGAAITTFAGQNIGAGRMDRVKGCMKQGMALSMVITIAISSLLLIFGIPLLNILTDDQAVVKTTYLIMWYFVPFYVVWTVIEVVSGILRGMGDAVRPVVIIGIGICLVRILWIAFAFRWSATLDTLCIGYIVSWFITAAALTVYYFVRRKKWAVLKGAGAF